MVGVIFQYYFMKILNLFDLFSPRCRTLTMSHNPKSRISKVKKLSVFATNL